MICCSIKCKNCLRPDGSSVREGLEWTNRDDPCMSHICSNGVISTHASLCSGIPCPPEHRFIPPGECCPTCSLTWASFCPEDFNCDIACQHGFAVDEQRGCDLCRCARKKIENTSTTLATTTKTLPETSSSDDATHKVPFYIKLNPADDSTKNIFFGIIIAGGIIFVACLAGIGWYFHRAGYKRAPLVRLRSSSA